MSKIYFLPLDMSRLLIDVLHQKVLIFFSNGYSPNTTSIGYLHPEFYFILELVQINSSLVFYCALLSYKVRTLAPCMCKSTHTELVFIYFLILTKDNSPKTRFICFHQPEECFLSILE